MSKKRKKLTIQSVFEVIDVELVDSSGVVVAYELREMNGTDRDAYMNEMTSRITESKSGNQTIEDFSGMQADLVCRCLYKAGEVTPQTAAFVQGLPGSVSKMLFEECNEMNGLADDEDNEGND